MTAEYNVYLTYIESYTFLKDANARCSELGNALRIAGIKKSKVDYVHMLIDENDHTIKLDIRKEFIEGHDAAIAYSDFLKSRMLKYMEIQSDRVYLEIERIMDVRIDCCIAAG